jgi:hypothetical protein
MGTSVALGVAAGKLFAGVAVTAGALAVGRAAAVALETAPEEEDAPGPQPGSASPTPTPSAEMATTLVTRVKRCGFIVASLSG